MIKHIWRLRTFPCSSPPAAHPQGAAWGSDQVAKHFLPLIPSSPPLLSAVAAVAAAPGTERF
jgi:hypothetical protein